MIKDNPLISVIIPVKNEAAILNRCLESLRNLDYPKDHLEIIVSDGLSTDNTRDIALSFGGRVVTNERQVVVSGRNCGFKEAKGDIVAFTDADCVFNAGWLKNSIKYFNDDKVGAVGGVTLTPLDSSSFEKAVDFIFSVAEIFKSTSHRKNITSLSEVNDIPGCNAIYRREALDKVMPVDENLLTAEDVWMNFCIRKSGYKFILAQDVILWHYRRSSPKKFLRQVYRFAVGRAQVGKRNLKLLNIFHILTGLSFPLIIFTGIYFYLSGALGLFLRIVLCLFIVMSLAAFVKTRLLSVSMNLPLVIILFVFGWSIGFLRELIFPLKDVKGR